MAKGKSCAKSLKTTNCLLGEDIFHLLAWESRVYGFVGEEPIFGSTSLHFLVLPIQVK